MYLKISPNQASPRFHAHANKIILTFDEAIKTLGTDESPAALQKIWSKIGTSHVKKGIAKESYIVSSILK